MKKRLLPMILGGLLIGLISMIPIIGWLWFIWAIAGGLLAVFFHYMRVKPDMQLIDGVWIGAGAGLIGGLVNLIGVTILAVIFSAFGAMMSSTSDPLTQFTTSLMFSLPGLALNIVWSVGITLIAFASGTLLAFILTQMNAKPQPRVAYTPPPTQPTQPFQQPPANPYDAAPPGSINPFDRR